MILVGSVAKSERFRASSSTPSTSLRVGYPDDPATQMGPIIEPASGKLLARAHRARRRRGVARRAEAARRRPGGCGRPASAPASRPGSTSTSPSSSARCSASCTPQTSRRRSACRTRSTTASPPACTRSTPTRSPLWLDTRRGRQPLRQPRHHRRDRAAPAVRRLEALVGRRRRQGRRPELPVRPRQLEDGCRRQVEDAAPARPRRPRDRPHRGVAGLARLRGVRPAAPGRPRPTPSPGARSSASCSDVSQLGVERNVFRYLPVPVAVRVAEDASLVDALRVIIAATLSKSEFTVSLPTALPARCSDCSTSATCPVTVETDAAWLAGLASRRRRCATSRGRSACVCVAAGSRDALATAVAGALDGTPGRRGVRRTRSRRPAASSCCRSCTSRRSRSRRTASATRARCPTG